MATAETARLKVEIEEKSKALNEGMVALVLKNADLENRLTVLVANNEALKERIAKLEADVAETLATLKRLVGNDD